MSTQRAAPAALVAFGAAVGGSSVGLIWIGSHLVLWSIGTFG